MNVRILRKGNRRIVAGPASVAIPDQEGDLITGQALAKALPEFLENSLISLNHMDVKIGDILKEYSDGSKVYRTEVRPITADDLETYGILKKGGAREGDIAFFLVAEFKAPADPEHYANKTWNEILKGELSCFSISGQALGSPKQGMKCDGLTCKMVNIIDNMAASAITVCKQGVNQAAGFNIVSKNITSGDDDMDMKFSEARKALLAKGTPEAIKQVAAMDDLLANFLSKAEPKKDCKCGGDCQCGKSLEKTEASPDTTVQDRAAARRPMGKEADCGCTDVKKDAPIEDPAHEAQETPEQEAIEQATGQEIMPPAGDVAAAPAPEAAPAVPVGTTEAEIVDQAPEGAQVADQATPEAPSGDSQVTAVVSAPLAELEQALEEAKQAVAQMLQAHVNKALADIRKELTGSTFEHELTDGTTDHGRIGYPSQPSGHTTHLAQSDESAVKPQKKQSEDWNDAEVNFEYPSGSDRQKDSPALTVRIAGDSSRQHGMAEQGDYPKSEKVGDKYVKKAATKQQFQDVGTALGTVGGGALGGVVTRNPKGAAAGAAIGGPLGNYAGGKVADKLHIKEMEEKSIVPKQTPQRPSGGGIPPTAATQPSPTRPVGKADDAVQQAPGKKTPGEKMEVANEEMDMELFQKPSADGHSDAFLEVHKMLVEEKGVDRQLAHQVANLVCGKQYFSKCFTCDIMTEKYDDPAKVFDGFKKAKDYGTVGFGLLSKHDTRTFMAEYQKAIELADWAAKAWQAQRSKRGTLMAVNSDNPNAKPLYGEKAARALAAQRRMGGQEQQTLEGGTAQPSGAGLTGSDVASSYLEAAGVDAADVPKLMQAIGQSSKGEIRGAKGLQAAKQAINQALQSLGYAPEGQISDDMARKLVNASMQGAGTSNMTFEEPTGGGEEMQPEMPQPSQNPVQPAQNPKVEQAKNRSAAEPVSGFTGGDVSAATAPASSIQDDGPAGVEVGVSDIEANVLSEEGEHAFPEGADPDQVADQAVSSYEEQQAAEEAAAMQNPEVQAMQAEQQMSQAELEQDKARHDAEMQMEQQRMQHDMQLEQTKLQQEMKINEQRAQVEQQQAQARMQQEQQMAQQQFQHDAQLSQQQMQQEAQMAQQEAAMGMPQQNPAEGSMQPDPLAQQSQQATWSGVDDDFRTADFQPSSEESAEFEAATGIGPANRPQRGQQLPPDFQPGGFPEISVDDDGYTEEDLDIEGFGPGERVTGMDMDGPARRRFGADVMDETRQAANDEMGAAPAPMDAPLDGDGMGPDEGLESLMPHEGIEDVSAPNPFDDATEYRDGADGDAAMQEIMDGIAADEAHFAGQEVEVDEAGMAPEQLDVDPMAAMNEQAVAERGVEDAMAGVTGDDVDAFLESPGVAEGVMGQPPKPTLAGPAAVGPQAEDGMAEEVLAEEPEMEPQAPAAPPVDRASLMRQQMEAMKRGDQAAAKRIAEQLKGGAASGDVAPQPAPAAAPAAAEQSMDDGTDAEYSPTPELQGEVGQSAFPKPRADTKRYWKEVSPQDLPAVQQYIKGLDMRQTLPAYAQGVQINPDSSTYDREPVARYIGKDGKPHPIYTHSYYEMTADPKKFERVRQNRPAIQQFVNEQFKMLGMPADSRERDVALMSLIAAETGMRRGNAVSAQKGRFGITTVPASAVTFSGDKAIFNYTGKAGAQQSYVVSEPRLVKALQEQVSMSQQMGRAELFGTKSIHAYNAMPPATRAKFHDFRTMKGTDVAMDAAQRLLASGQIPRDEASLGQFMKMVHEAVAKQLGNTPEVAGQSYVDPAVFDEARAGMGGQPPQAPKPEQQMPVKKGFAPEQPEAVQAAGLDETAEGDEEMMVEEEVDGAEYVVPSYLQNAWKQAFGEAAPQTMLVPPMVVEEMLREAGAGALLDQLKQQSGTESGAGFKSPEPQGQPNPGGFDQAAY